MGMLQMKKNVLGALAMMAFASFVMATPAVAVTYCGAGKILSLASDIPQGTANGKAVSNATNLLIHLDYSLVSKPVTAYEAHYLGSDWIPISYTDSVRWKNVIKVVYAAYLSGTPIHIVNTLNNDCRSTDSNVTITTCANGPGATSMCGAQPPSVSE